MQAFRLRRRAVPCGAFAPLAAAMWFPLACSSTGESRTGLDGGGMTEPDAGGIRVKSTHPDAAPARVVDSGSDSLERDALASTAPDVAPPIVTPCSQLASAGAGAWQNIT